MTDEPTPDIPKTRPTKLVDRYLSIATKQPQGGAAVARIISVIVLVVFTILVGAIFYRVMSGFILPLFLAALLAVLFRPLHLFIVRKSKGFNRVAAVLTVVTILVIVLAPLIGILFRAATDAVEMVQGNGPVHVNMQGFNELVEEANSRFGLSIEPEELRQTIQVQVQHSLEPLAQRTPGFLASFIIGLLVMIIALYYFLVDGDEMIATLTRMLPLDHRYQQELIMEFDKVSRAVVMATLLSALAQGALACIAFMIAGLHSIFLLTMLTMIGSMIPFVGAAAVWVCCAVWLFFVEDRTGMAIFMVVYGATIVSSVDNLIKPIVLHGQSKLHPLLALLSVLGGVRALGPIGVFVGPMAVAFLQAGLNMLHSELGSLRRDPKAEPDEPNLAASTTASTDTAVDSSTGSPSDHAPASAVAIPPATQPAPPKASSRRKRR